MKNIVFIHGGDVMRKEHPVSDKNVSAYQKLFQLGFDRGHKLVWSNTRYFDTTKNVFTSYSWFDGSIWNRVNEDLKPDYIFEKSKFSNDDLKVKRQMEAATAFLNPVEMTLIASDKMLTYSTFPDEVNFSIPVSSNSDIIESVDKIKSEIIVFKPVNGACGRGVEFLTHEKAKKFQPNVKYIMQEFVDSSNGIPGIYKGIHDLRLMFLDNKLFHSFYRTQAPGSYLCSVTFGAELVVVPIEDLPKSVIEMSKVVQERFKNYKNIFYSIDYHFDLNGNPKIIELNTSPGLDNTPGYDLHLIELYNNILDHIEKYI